MRDACRCRGIESYKQGFGNLTGDFWLGNDKIHHITSSEDYVMRVDVEDYRGNTGQIGRASWRERV